MHVALTVLICIVGAILAVSLVIFIHEFGHFGMARLLGFNVEKFSIGFGRPIWRRISRNGTEYRLAWFPLGGYVKLSEHGEKPYMQFPVYKRLLVVSAGVIMNFVCAIVLFAVVYTVGFETHKPIIGSVIINSLADQSGIQPGDQIIAVQGQATQTWSNVLMPLLLKLGNPTSMPLTVIRNNKEKTLSINLAKWKIDGIKQNLFSSVGFIPDRNSPLFTIQTPWYRSISVSANEVGKLTFFNFVMLKKLLFHQLPTDLLGGPVSIFEQAGKATLEGLVTFIAFIAYLNIMLAIINMLPIPLLDGGQFVILLIEGVRRKPLSNNALLLVQRIGFIIIAVLLVQALLNDIQRLFF